MQSYTLNDISGMDKLILTFNEPTMIYVQSNSSTNNSIIIDIPI
jgi:hypothetical protein